MTRRTATRLAQAIVTLAAFSWLATRLSLPELAESLGRLPLRALLLGTGLWTLSFVVAALRWRWTMQAYGSREHLPTGWIVRVCWAGMFYNTWAPGGVGGDLMRGVAARRAFPGSTVGSTATGLAVTGIDRVLGLAGLLLLVGGVLTIRPIAGQESIRSIAALGAVAALSLAAMLGSARRLAPYLPQVLAAPMSALPPVTSPARLLQCLAASVSTHLLTALSGHALVQGLVPDASVADALVFVPLSMATIYLPITVGGAGVREAAFASLYGTVGIDESTAVAASIGMFGIQLAVSGVGGLLHLWWPLGITPSPDSQETD